jgi:hypothetical protein
MIAHVNRPLSLAHSACQYAGEGNLLHMLRRPGRMAVGIALAAFFHSCLAPPGEGNCRKRENGAASSGLVKREHSCPSSIAAQFHACTIQQCIHAVKCTANWHVRAACIRRMQPAATRALSPITCFDNVHGHLATRGSEAHDAHRRIVRAGTPEMCVPSCVQFSAPAVHVCVYVCARACMTAHDCV